MKSAQTSSGMAGLRESTFVISGDRSLPLATACANSSGRVEHTARVCYTAVQAF
jgi:hypothetical protein